MKKKWIVIFLCVTALVSTSIRPTQVVEAKTPPPDGTGPFVVGYIHQQLVDNSRTSDVDGMPVSEDIWYPADPANGRQPLQTAQYVMDVYNWFGIFWERGFPTFPSSAYEGHGLSPAYQEPVPSSDGPFPLMVFSPGWGVSPFYYFYLGARLASYGFVVVIQQTYNEWADSPAMPMLDRTKDIEFIINDLLARNQDPNDRFFGLINPDQIALSGHSLGGYAALALASGDANICDTAYYEPTYPPPPPEACVPVLPDPRIKAVVTLDGSNQFLHFSELAQITIPAMGIGEEWNTLFNSDPEWASWQARAHAAIQGHPNYRVDIALVEHMSFADWCHMVDVAYDIGMLTQEEYDENICGVPPIPDLEVQRLTVKYMAAFLEVNLSGDHGYQYILTPGYAKNQEPYIEFFETEKKNPHSIHEDFPDNFIYFMHQPGSEQARGPKEPQGLMESRASQFLLP